MHAFDRCAYFFVSFRQSADKGARGALFQKLIRQV